MESDARIQDLPAELELHDNDRFPFEHLGNASCISAGDLIRYLFTAADAGGTWGVHTGASQPAGTQSVWIDTSTGVPTLKFKDSGTGEWISLPVVTQATTLGDFKRWNLDVNKPVGSLFWCDHEINPAEHFGGGVWERITDKFIMAAGPEHPAGVVSGAFKIVQTIEQMPHHDHTIHNPREDFSGSQQTEMVPVTNGTATPEAPSYSWRPTGKTGGGQPMDITNTNVPYYCWRRIA